MVSPSSSFVVDGMAAATPPEELEYSVAHLDWMISRVSAMIGWCEAPFLVAATIRRAGTGRALTWRSPARPNHPCTPRAAVCCHTETTATVPMVAEAI